VDFFTPIVDDAESWGAIAAANALSDVYAMGGRPLSALGILAWPRDSLDWAELGETLDGAARVLNDAGCALVGGHSIDDPEPKYGLAVTGTVDPRRLITNSAGQPGDTLFLTKPLGSGVVTTAAKARLADSSSLEIATSWMRGLNRTASEIAVELGLRCGTDVTGFGLVGHLTEICRASGLGAELFVDTLPVMDGVAALAASAPPSGGLLRNQEAAMSAGLNLDLATEAERVLSCDPQTSGGLLLAVPSALEVRFEELCSARDQFLARIGRLVAAATGQPHVGFTRVHD
jgi:selenide,water dikinase